MCVARANHHTRRSDPRSRDPLGLAQPIVPAMVLRLTSCRTTIVVPYDALYVLCRREFQFPTIALIPNA